MVLPDAGAAHHYNAATSWMNRIPAEALEEQGDVGGTTHRQGIGAQLGGLRIC
jgi:hypothetical protein